MDAHLGEALLRACAGQGASSPELRPELLRALAQARRAAGARALAAVHLLTGALEDPTARAALLLHALDVPRERLLEQAARAGPGPDDEAPAHEVLWAAVRERFQAEPLGTEHLLLALIQEPGPAGCVLVGAGLVYRETRRVARELQASLP